MTILERIPLAITQDASLTPVEFTVQDENKNVDSFVVTILIWNPADHEWVQSNTGVLQVSPWSGRATKAANAIFTVSADLEKIKHNGGDPQRKSSSLIFMFDDPDNGDSGFFGFKAGSNQWHYAGYSDQSEIDIDWQWDSGDHRDRAERKVSLSPGVCTYAMLPRDNPERWFSSTFGITVRRIFHVLCWRIRRQRFQAMPSDG